MVPTFAPTPRETGRIIVAIPALNEERSIGGVVRDLRQQGYACVVVDDGSRDGTGAAARQAGATVLRHPFPLGQGAALQTGIHWALADGADVIVTFDADGQHRSTDIALLLEALTQHEADYALGSRFLGAVVNAPARRRLLLNAATRFTRISTGMPVTDTHNGLRAMTRRGAGAIQLRQNKMAHASEILHQISRSRLPWVEVPVTIVYTPETLAKGQQSTGMVAILADLLMGRLER
jgi:glycosyltransferase involved in cell wall biosynthesis